jgi:mono/diheme cytochrome c family protein
MRSLSFLLLLVLVLRLAACGGGSEAPAATAGGDAAAGEVVFSETAVPACSTCHSLEPGVTIVGPSLANIGTQAGSMEAGVSAEDYLRQSIITPDSFVVEGFASGIMPMDYGAQLTEKQIQDLVAYLLTLK